MEWPKVMIMKIKGILPLHQATASHSEQQYPPPVDKVRGGTGDVGGQEPLSCQYRSASMAPVGGHLLD